MVRRTSRDKASGAADSDLLESKAQRLRPSRLRKLSTSTLLQELALRPEFLEGVHLGEVLIPEPLRRRGQWVVRAQDLLSFHLEFANLRAEAVAGADHAAVLATAGPGAAYITLHFAPQAIAERVFFAAASKGQAEQDGHVDDKTGQPPPTQSPTPLEPLAPPPIGTRIAYPSRLVFRFEESRLRAAGIWPVPYTLAGILEACRALNLNVTANARYQLPLRIAKVPPYRQARGADVRRAYKQLSVAEKSALLASARRNEQLARRLGSQATVVLLRRAEVAPVPSHGALQRAPEGEPSDHAPAPAAAAAEAVYLPTTPAALALGSSMAAVNLADRPGYTYLSLPRPRKPAANETALEIPFRLLLSPNGDAFFAHDQRPSLSQATGHTGLWHTRLAERQEAESGIHQELKESVRAVWARGGPESDHTIFTDHWSATPDSPPPDTKPFRQTLDDRDRYNIVQLSGNFALHGGRHEAIDCQRLMLSTLGGWLDARGDWKVPEGLSVEQWVHHAAQARDHYVRVIYKGFLLPFGHRVSLVKISERFFQKDQPGNAAYVLQRMFFIVREPVREYPETSLFKMVGGKRQYYHRSFPFPVVRLLTEVTPDIRDPNDTDIDNQLQAFFWPALPSSSPPEPFRFQYVATDLDGSEIQFDLPAIFIDNALANPADDNSHAKALAKFQLARQAWLGADPAWRTTTMRRQKVALAPSAKPGDTANEVDALVIGAETEGLVGAIQSPFIRPTIVQSDVRIPCIGALTGGAGGNVLRYEEGYLALQSGYGDGEVYAKLDAGGQGLDFKSCGNRSGGFVQPSLAPSGLSRKKGPVSGNLADVAAGQFKPTDFFSELGPLLFGCIPLGELVTAIAGPAGFAEMPSFVTEALQEGEALFSNLGRLDKVEEQVAGLVRNAAKAAIEQAIERAFAQVTNQLAVLDATTSAIKTQAQAVVTAATSVAAAMGSAADSLLTNPVQLQTAIDPVRNALQTLGIALANRDAALQVPGADGLSASTVQVVRQQIALVQQRIAQVNALLADFANIPSAITSAQDVIAKLAPVLVSPVQLKALIDGGTLGPLLTALNTSLGAFGNALKPLKLVEGTAKQSLLTLIGTLDPVLSAVNKLLPIIESLIGEEIVVRFAFTPTLAPWPPASGHPLSGLGTLFRPNDPKGFVVAVEARVKKSGGAPTANVRCALTHFDLILLGNAGFIQLDFEKIEFTADSSAKTNVDVGFSGIHFIGVLSFVEALRDLIPLDGFSDPPALTIDEHGIDASFSIALPNLAVGVMSLTNLSLGAGFTVPFIGQPLSVRFNFCKREAPFNLTVTLFGGGGFFGITIDPHGVQILEASFEFGAAIAIDFGVASGGVHVMAGIYFRMEPDKASLTGYFRLGGYVDVLGLISASIELYMDLVYVFDEGKCIGHATLTIEVHVIFFSASVSISCERKFAGSSGDPSFAALMGPGEGVPLTTDTRYAWREYCEAFA